MNQEKKVEEKKSLTQYFSKKDIINSIIAGILWTLTYLYIRRYWNPATRNNFMDYKDDAIYGGIAAAVALAVRSPILKYLEDIGLYKK